jgi:hypothetical protein
MGTIVLQPGVKCRQGRALPLGAETMQSPHRILRYRSPCVGLTGAKNFTVPPGAGSNTSRCREALLC